LYSQNNVTYSNSSGSGGDDGDGDSSNGSRSDLKLKMISKQEQFYFSWSQSLGFDRCAGYGRRAKEPSTCGIGSQQIDISSEVQT
jgi:hypothetical protein